jgi:purine-binding chemotaxis protein CheW
MNLERRFGGRPADESAEALANKRVVVVDLNGVLTGIQVDSVSQVLNIQKKQIERPPDIVKSGDADCLKGVGKLDSGKRLIMLLDAGKLISSEDYAQITENADQLRAQSKDSAAKKADASDEIQLVCFKVNKEEYAVDIMKVQEIIRLREITSVPHAKNYMQGIINLRGTVVPVVDMRTRFGLGKMQAAESNRIVVVNIDGRVTGLIVDSVSEVLRVSRDLIEKPPTAVSGVEGKFIEGVGKLAQGKRIIVLVRVEALLVEAA